VRGNGAFEHGESVEELRQVRRRGATLPVFYAVILVTFPIVRDISPIPAASAGSDGAGRTSLTTPRHTQKSSHRSVFNA
jgi:hypothetical protein